MLSAAEGRPDSRPAQAAATVADVMRLAAETVAEGDHVAAATYLMQHASATSLVVTDFQAGKPVGVITAADIARAVADGRDLNEIRIYHLLITRPAPISAATPVRDAAEAMLTGGFRQLPVTGDGDSIGIVDLTDLVDALPSSRHLTMPSGRGRPASDSAAIKPGQSICVRCSPAPSTAR
jgi:CBS domain-containing protein